MKSPGDEGVAVKPAVGVDSAGGSSVVGAGSVGVAVSEPESPKVSGVLAESKVVAVSAGIAVSDSFLFRVGGVGLVPRGPVFSLAAVPYWLYVSGLVLFLAAILVTPLLEASGNPVAGTLQAVLAPTCHQLAERSYCYFFAASGQFNGVGDCDSRGAQFGPWSREHAFATPDGGTAFKLPVCARDTAIYAAMLLGALVYPLFFKLDGQKFLPLYIFVLALVPIGLDGGSQLVGLRQSSNVLRLVTGAMAGFVLSLYVIPILNRVWEAMRESIKKQPEDSRPANR